MLQPHLKEKGGDLWWEFRHHLFCSLRQSPVSATLYSDDARHFFLLLLTLSTKSRCTLVHSSRDKHVPFFLFCRRPPRQFLCSFELPIGGGDSRQCACTREISWGLLERFGAKEGRSHSSRFRNDYYSPERVFFFGCLYASRHKTTTKALTSRPLASAVWPACSLNLAGIHSQVG